MLGEVLGLELLLQGGRRRRRGLGDQNAVEEVAHQEVIDRKQSRKERKGTKCCDMRERRSTKKGSLKTLLFIYL